MTWGESDPTPDQTAALCARLENSYSTEEMAVVIDLLRGRNLALTQRCVALEQMIADKDAEIFLSDWWSIVGKVESLTAAVAFFIWVVLR